MSESPVLLSHDAQISTITINRPSSLNALNAETLQVLKTTVLEVAERSATRVVIVTGAGGKAFVAGADIAGMANMNGEQGHVFGKLGGEAFAAIEALRVPVIAAVGGFALGGGCELALACDFIYASTRAKFGQPEVKLGIIPGFGGTQRLPRRVGLGMARELIYTGRIIGAAEALRIGLVNAVVEPGDLLEHVNQTAQEMANNGPLALAQAKLLISAGLDQELAKGVSAEAKAFGDLFETADQSEGMTAFLEKRKADFAAR